MSQFGQPAVANPEDKFNASEHLGMLLLFFPTELKQGVPTIHGNSDAVATKLVNLDNGRVLNDTLIFPTALVTQLKGAVAEQGMVLGRLGQGTPKNGNSAPWLLSPHEAQDVARAEAYLAANPRNQFQNGPAPVAAPPTPVASAAPATGGWGVGTQGGAAVAPVAQAPAPAAGGADPRVAALAVKLVAAGAPVQPGMTYDQLVAIAGLVGVAV